MDDLLKKAIDFYSRTSEQASPAVRAGRYEKDADKEGAIWTDLLEKMRVSDGQNILDLGCGCGTFARNWRDLARTRSLRLTLLDFPDVVAKLKDEIATEDLADDRIRLVSGVFPYELPDGFRDERYDRVVLYSVIHYTKHSDAVIEAAVRMLKPGGRLLVGDIPNMSKKGRFLASEAGRAFEANYRGKPIDEIPRYDSADDYERKHQDSGISHLNDRFIVRTIEKYRREGFDAYVLEQPPTLPFCLSREDLVIAKSQE